MSGSVSRYNRNNPRHNSADTIKGSLTIVGSGIQAARQYTLESQQAIEQADRVLFLVNDSVSELWIRKNNPNSESLIDSYAQGKYRPTIYKEITQRILKYVREGLNVCVVFYGHPGVFVNPSHNAIKLALSEGFEARMLPGISAEDCLFADLGVDPGSNGCLSIEATDFLLHRRKFDTSCHLILWQIGTVCDPTNNSNRVNKPGLRSLADYLIKYYGPNHDIVVYKAPELIICKPSIRHLFLSELGESPSVEPGSTLYVSPKAAYKGPIEYYNIAYKLALAIRPVNFNFLIKKLFRSSSFK